MEYKFKSGSNEQFLQIVSDLKKLGYKVYEDWMPEEHQSLANVFTYSNGDITWDASGEAYFKRHRNIEAWIKDGKIVTEPPLCYLHGKPVWADTPLQTTSYPNSNNAVWKDTSSIFGDDNGFFDRSILDSLISDPTWEKFYRVKPAEEKRITAEQLVQNIAATTPGATFEVEDASTPLLGLTPRCINDQERIVAILDAMKRFVEGGMPVDSNWYEELGELLKEARYVS